VLAFKLGGMAKLPPMARTAELPPAPPPLRASEAEVQRGAELFAENCSLCHGRQAIGGLKDLRLMTPESHAMFNTIVLEGTLQEKGMASFADRLSKEEVEAIHAYVIARANEDWGKTVNPAAAATAPKAE